MTPPRITLLDVPQQIENLLPDDLASSPLPSPFQNFPNTVPPQDQERLRRDATGVVQAEVYPVYRKLHDYLVETYTPAARTAVGLSALPDGDAWYAQRVRLATTTNLSPRRIREIGLGEVKAYPHGNEGDQARDRVRR